MSVRPCVQYFTISSVQYKCTIPSELDCMRACVCMRVIHHCFNNMTIAKQKKLLVNYEVVPEESSLNKTNTLGINNKQN